MGEAYKRCLTLDGYWNRLTIGLGFQDTHAHDSRKRVMRNNPPYSLPSGYNVERIETRGFRTRWRAVSALSWKGPPRKSYNSAVADAVKKAGER